MTQFVTAMIPPDVDTVEKLHLWSGAILTDCYPEKTTYESAGNEVRNLSVIPFFNDTSEFPNLWHWQVIIRASILLTANYLKGGQCYQHAQSLGEAEIAAAFLNPAYVEV